MRATKRNQSKCSRCAMPRGRIPGVNDEVLNTGLITHSRYEFVKCLVALHAFHQPLTSCADLISLIEDLNVLLLGKIIIEQLSTRSSEKGASGRRDTCIQFIGPETTLDSNRDVAGYTRDARDTSTNRTELLFNLSLHIGDTQRKYLPTNQFWIMHQPSPKLPLIARDDGRRATAI